ncbi:hypothetical protein F511_32625 [Dorcoceras hygrometricum]|uniref:Uncharacterized protein n=1 Tax=Dorcoceras hygrometricum TaxID=472368 RepID=A0A2Z7C848_9LAMI|nr:hypothetical protein F511_32625 [Dorcoceras hygrometricum]
MVVDLIGIYGLKGPYCTLTMTNLFFQALSVIPRGSWDDVDEEIPSVQISSVLLVQADEGVLFLVVDRIGVFYRNLPRRAGFLPTKELGFRSWTGLGGRHIQPLKCRFSREIGVLTVPGFKFLNLPLRPGSGIQIHRCANSNNMAFNRDINQSIWPKMFFALLSNVDSGLLEVSIKRATQEESSATNLVQNNGWNRQKSREEMFR